MALEPETTPNLFGQLELERRLERHHIADIRETEAMQWDFPDSVGFVANRNGPCRLPAKDQLAIQLSVYTLPLSLSRYRSPGIEPGISSAGAPLPLNQPVPRVPCTPAGPSTP